MPPLVKTYGRRPAPVEGQAGWGSARPFDGKPPASESRMRGLSGKPRLKQGLFLTCALTASLGLASCSDIGNSIDSLFGSDDEAAANAAPPDTGGADQTPPPAAVAAAPSAGGVPVATITPVTIEPGADTGT